MIEMNKQYKTRDGREVRILMLDGGGERPVIAVAREAQGIWCARRFANDGSASSGGRTDHDLIEVKPERTVWVNMYLNPSDDCAHYSRESADGDADSYRLACVKVTYREGDGL